MLVKLLNIVAFTVTVIVLRTNPHRHKPDYHLNAKLPNPTTIVLEKQRFLPGTAHVFRWKVRQFTRFPDADWRDKVLISSLAG